VVTAPPHKHIAERALVWVLAGRTFAARVLASCTLVPLAGCVAAVVAVVFGLREVWKGRRK